MPLRAGAWLIVICLVLVASMQTAGMHCLFCFDRLHGSIAEVTDSMYSIHTCARHSSHPKDTTCLLRILPRLLTHEIK